MPCWKGFAGGGISMPPTFVFQIDSSAVPGGVAPEFVALERQQQTCM